MASSYLELCLCVTKCHSQRVTTKRRIENEEASCNKRVISSLLSLSFCSNNRKKRKRQHFFFLLSATERKLRHWGFILLSPLSLSVSILFPLLTLKSFFFDPFPHYINLFPTDPVHIFSLSLVSKFWGSEFTPKLSQMKQTSGVHKNKE